MPNNYILRNYGDNCFFKDSPTKRYERYHSQKNYSIYNFYGCNSYMPAPTCMPYNYGFGLSCGGGGFSFACGPFALSFGNNNFSFALGPMSMSFGTAGCGLGFGGYSLGLGNYDLGLGTYSNQPYYSPGLPTYGITPDYGITERDRLLYGGGDDDEVEDGEKVIENSKEKDVDASGCQCGNDCSCKSGNNTNTEVDLDNVPADDVFKKDSNYNATNWVIKNENELKSFIYDDDDTINAEKLNKVLNALGFETEEIRYNNAKLTCLELPNSNMSKEKMQALKIISDITEYPIAFAENETESDNVTDKYIIGKITDDNITEEDNNVSYKIDCSEHGQEGYKNTYDATYDGDTLTLRYNSNTITYRSPSCTKRNNDEPFVSNNTES